jgi:predicted nuclease of restriction endonuclease-like RecB superfamily
LLPSNLLRARISRGKIRPLFVGIEPATRSLAERVVHAYSDGVGRKKGELSERLREVENQGYDFKLVRGLSALLERRCTFEAESEGGLNPVEARRAVFREASRQKASNKDDKEKVLRKVSAELGVSRDSLERTLFSDIDDELENSLTLPFS